MAKGQKRSSKEIRKPKMDKPVVAPAQPLLGKGLTPQTGGKTKKG